MTASLVGSLRTAETAVTVSRTGGTATSGTDYGAISNFTVTIAAGAGSGTATLSFDPTEDNVDEDNETVVLTGTASGLTAGTATLTITDNDGPPTAVTLGVSPSSVLESASATSITVTASLVGSLRTADTAVTVSRTGGTATSGTDYGAISNFTVTIAAGAGSGTATLSFDPTEDNIDEDNETVVLTGTASGLTAGTATLTITDNDGAPTVGDARRQPVLGAGERERDEHNGDGLAGGFAAHSGHGGDGEPDGGDGDLGDGLRCDQQLHRHDRGGGGQRDGDAELRPHGGQHRRGQRDSGADRDRLGPDGRHRHTDDHGQRRRADGRARRQPVLGAGERERDEHNGDGLAGGFAAHCRATAVTVSRTGGTATSGTDYGAISNFTVTIAAGAGSGTATLSFDPTEDNIDEDNETVVLTGTASGLTAGTATLTITDNDGAPTVGLGVSPSSVLESASATSITVTASLVGSLRTAETAVTVSRTGGTATSGTDYGAISNFTVTIAAGAGSGTATLSFDPTEDNIDEDNETVVLTGTASGLTAGTATLTITDNDGAPTVGLGVNPSSVLESADATSITVTASLVGSLRTAETAVTVSRTGGTATSGTDYGAISNFTVTIAAGAGSGTATLSFDPTEDNIDEDNETVVLTGTASGLTAGTATLTITDNDGAPTVGLGVNPSSVLESASATSITVTASLVGSLRTAETAVTVSRTGGTATSGTDYGAISNFTVTIAAGAGSGTATLSFDPTEDNVDEDNETVVLTGTASGLTAGTATLTITDNDGAPTVGLGVSPSSVLESASATSITVTASLVGSLRTAETAVTVSRTGGTATSGTDYGAISNFTVTIAAGAGSGTATLSFDPTEDNIDEDNETVVLTGTASGLTAGTATLTITDNDGAPTVGLGVSPSSVLESASATSITVTASLVGSLRTAETAVTVSRTGGTATSGTDYGAISNFTVTIAAGAGSGTATLSFDPTEDNVDEDNETVVLTGTASGLTAGTATLTITDNDGAPTVGLGVNPSSVLESASATSITVTASLVGSLRTAETAVTVSRTGGTATSGTDYGAISNFTVTIAAGASSGTATLSFDPTEDNIDEDDETVVLTGTASGLTAGTATLTITDNDGAPTVGLGVNPSSVLESADATSITVTASLVGSRRTADTAVTVSRTGGTATSGTDYGAISNFTVTIAAGAGSGTATLSFDPTEDNIDEDNETVVLTGTASGLTAGTATLTITDNDGAPTAVTLSLSPAVVSEGAGSVSVTAVVEVVGGTREEATAAAVSVAGGSAEAGTDYAAVSPFTATIPSGETRAEEQFNFEPLDDSIREEHETVRLRVAVGGEGGTSLTATTTLTILDNDGTVSLSVAPRRIGEGAPPTEVTVTAVADPPVGDGEGPLGITVRCEAQETEPSVEFSTAPESLRITIPAGEDSGTATLVLIPVDDRTETRDTRIRVGGTADSSDWVVRPTTLLVVDNDESENEWDPERGLPAVTLWTDRLDYREGEEIRLYLDIDPHGDEREYTAFFYLESIETGQRQYLAPRSRSHTLRDEVVDQRGRVRDAWRAARLQRIERQLAWIGEAPRPGLWHFVAELRSPGTTEVLKRAYAKFVVPEHGSVLLSGRGTERTLSTEMRLTNDGVYFLLGRLQVSRGATLAIEAGTLIKAWGPAAAILVEPGGRIEVRGRREAPVLMTCSGPVGQRSPGCWGGLTVRGEGGTRNSSGQLRYLRVEFAGGGSAPEAPAPALAFEGVGGGTLIDHVQVHASLGDGLAFRGGTAHCSYCVSSDALHDSLVWSGGWQGSAQHLYVRQGAQAASALRGREAIDAPPLAGPAFRNVTLVGGYMIGVPGGAPGTSRSIGPGVVLDGQAALTAWNLLVTGFGGFAVDAAAASFADGRSRIAGAVLSHSGYRRGQSSLVRGTLKPYVQYTRADPDLIDLRHGANPDPRPRSGSATRKLGTAVAPPFDARFTAAADYAGAFGKRNWLEEWTFFGAERDYQPPGQDPASQSRQGALPQPAVAPVSDHFIWLESDGGAGGPHGGIQP